MEHMIKMIRFTSELEDDDGYTPIFSHLELPYIEGMDLDKHVDSWNYVDGYIVYLSLVMLYPDRQEDIDKFNTAGHITYKLFGYERREDVLTLNPKYDELPGIEHNRSVYISAKRIGIEYNYDCKLFKHIVEVTYRKFKLNKGFTWSYVGEPYTVIEHLQDDDFKQIYG